MGGAATRLAPALQHDDDHVVDDDDDEDEDDNDKFLPLQVVCDH